MLTVIETNRNLAGPEVASTCTSSSSHNRYETEHEYLIEALSQLYNLLENFSPSWYTERYRLKAESALHVKRR